MPRSNPRRASSLKAIIFATVSLLLDSYVGAEFVISGLITLDPRVLTHNLRQEARGYQTERWLSRAGELEGAGAGVSKAAEAANERGISLLGLSSIKERVE